MKRKSRDFQIFNVSALDLFASALGAFILISVVLFPFFPNTGQSEERVAELHRRIAALGEEVDRLKGELERTVDAVREANAERDRARAERDAARADAAQARQQIEAMRPKSLDLVIVLDITGSMGPEIQALRAEIGVLARLLTAVAPDTAMRVVAYGDAEWAGRVPGHTAGPTRGVTIESELLPIRRGSRGVVAMREFLNSLSPGMGVPDIPHGPGPEEALLLGLNRAIQATPWRQGSQLRRIVVIADNPAYQNEVGAALSAAELFSASQPGSQTSTVFVRTEVSNPGAESFMRQLALRGGGAFATGARDQGPQLLADIVESVLR